MRRIICFMALAALLAAACSKGSKPPAEQAPPPPVTAASVPVLAQIELPSGRNLGTSDAVLDAIRAGSAAQAGAMLPGMLAELVEAPGLEGADLDQPVRLVVLDPQKHAKPVVLAVAVANADELTRSAGKERVDVQGTLALIGERGAVDAARGYILGTLATRRPDRPRGVVFPGPVLQSFGTQIEAFKAQMGVLMAMSGQGQQVAELLPLYMDMVLAVFEQSETLEVTLASNGGLAGAELVLRPRADTTLAGFAKVQEPADLALLSKLPPGEDMFLIMAGRLAAGPAREPFMKLGTQIMEAFFAGGTGEAEMTSIIEPWMRLFEGDFAALAPVPGDEGMQMVQLLTVSDSAKAADYSRQFGQAVAARAEGIEVMGMKQTIAFQPKVFEHDGVAVAEQRTTFDTSDGEPEQQAAMEAMGGLEMTSYIAGFDAYLGMTMGSTDRMRALIDTARGKAPGFVAEGGMVRALDMTRARKDSLMVLADLGVLYGSLGTVPDDAPRVLALSLGFVDGSPNLFIGVRR